MEFNLSHTANVVACAVSEFEIGVDVQKKVCKYENVLRRACCKNEIDLVLGSQTPIDDFAKVWTLKESYTKCIGTGIFDMMAECDFSLIAKQNGGRAYGYEFTVLDSGDYALAVCSSQMTETIKKVSLSELYNFMMAKNA